ncbi:MAG: hypothetical protein RL204_1287 [Bacteroidota bacterium]|jgi:hypothetical protein
MKSKFTMRAIALSIIALTFFVRSEAQVLGEVLYSWDFAEGLPSGWTNTSDTGISLWEYRGPNTVPSNAVCSRGSCSSSSSPLQSQTLANGFFIFDSNYWDDSGPSCGAGFGQGLDPAPHDAFLTSGLLDFTNYSAVVITFQQQFRHYIASSKLQVSNDGGATWIDAGSNTGAESGNVEWKSYNISSLAAGQNDVKFRFRFTGTYYWWLIDDVYIYSPNDNDIAISAPKYVNNPTPDNIFNDLEYDQYPLTMLVPFNFSATATNIGGMTQNSVNLTTNVLNSSSSIIHTQTSASTNLIAGQVAVFNTPSAYTPPSVIGDYTIEYIIDQSQTDESLLDNVASKNFTISEHTYARDEGPIEDIYTPGGTLATALQEIGNIFEGTNQNRKCYSITVALGEGTTVGSQIQAIVYDENLEEVITMSDPYTVNIADLNQIGEEFTITLPLQSPIVMYNDTIFNAMVRSITPGASLNVGRSGQAPESTCFVRYYELNFLFFLAKIPIVRMNIFNNNVTPGCMDATAMNYNSSATVEDHSCRYPGCTNENASNYSPTANWDDNSCVVEGCTDPEAFNYDPLATIDNGSCVTGGCTNPLATNYDPNADVDDGSCYLEGCTNILADNYNPAATVDDGSCIIFGCTDPNADNYNSEANTEDDSCIYSGCTNPEASNYDPQANLDDGSCTIFGCTNFEALNYNPNANVDDGSCQIPGCTDPEADNYDVEANFNDGTCVYLGCTNPNAINFDPFANVDNGTCIVEGCTDPIADNYNPEANSENGSCEYLGCTDTEASNYDPTAVTDDGSCIYPGCTDPEANNFDPNANQNDGSCLYNTATFEVNITEGCAPLSVNITNQTDLSGGGICDFTVDGSSIQNECLTNFNYIFDTPGVYFITYEFTQGVSTSTATVGPITVYGPPTAPVLEFNNDDNSMTCTNCFATENAWYLDNELLSQTTNPISVSNVNGAPDNGYYTLTITDENGCSSSSDELLVFEMELSYSQTNQCIPSEMIVTNTTDVPVGGSMTIDWDNGLGIQNANNGINAFTYDAAGTYQIELVLSWNGNETSTTYEITVNEGTVLNLVWDQLGNIVYCVNCENGSSSWTIDNNPVVGEGPWDESLGTNYYVEFTNEFGCVSDASISTIGINEFDVNELSLYPNPASSEIRISQDRLPYSLQIVDMSGRIVYSQENISQKSLDIDISSFSQGLYQVQTISGGIVKHSKLEIVR